MFAVKTANVSYMLKNVSFCFLKVILVLVECIRCLQQLQQSTKKKILTVASLEKVIHFSLILLENIHTP